METAENKACCDDSQPGARVTAGGGVSARALKPTAVSPRLALTVHCVLVHAAAHLTCWNKP